MASDRRVDGADRRHGLGPDAREHLGQTDQQIGIGGDGEARHPEHEVTIQHGVLKLRALALDFGRDRHGGDLGQGQDQRVDSVKTHQVRETMVGHAGTRLERVRRDVHGRADHQGGQRVAQRREFADQRAADGQRAVIGLGQVAVE